MPDIHAIDDTIEILCTAYRPLGDDHDLTGSMTQLYEENMACFGVKR